MASLIDIIQRFGIEHLGRYYSIYRGVVVNNSSNDPGVLKVTIPSIHTGITVWARSKAQIGGPGIGVKYIIPEVGSIVNVEFERGDPMKPLWSYMGFLVGDIPDELKANDSFGIITPMGNQIYVHDKAGELHLKIKGNEGNKDLTIDILKDKGQIVINGGEKGGVLNIEQFNSLIEALMKDLTIAQSGTNLSEWSAKEWPKIEDKRFLH